MNIVNKILVVEDEHIVARDIQQKLIKLGYDVPAYLSTGEEAIAETEKLQPNLVIMDIKLDGKIDGIEAGQQIRSRFDIPIIYLTAYGDKHTLERVKLSEPDGYIMKPFNIKELHSNIQVALHKNKMEKKLKEHHQWLLNTLQSMGNAVITTNEKKIITYLNDAAQDLLEINKNNALGKTINDITTLTSQDSKEPVNLFSNLSTINNNTELSPSDYILTTQHGKKMIVEISTSIIKQYDGSLDGYVFSIQDVTQQRDGIKVLQKMSKELERRVEKRTAELKQINTSLQKEITDRKKAEERAKQVQTSIENIINSTSEIIIALDNCNRVEYWNTAAEKLTGFKKKDVSGRYLSKLPFINDAKRINEIIKQVDEKKEIIYENIIFITKKFSKRILNISCSPIHPSGEKTGIVFVGKDITYDWESHHNLIQGHSYIIAEKNKHASFSIFSNLIFSDYHGVYITRSQPDQINDELTFGRIKPVFIRKQPHDYYQTIHTVTELVDQIKSICSQQQKSVIFFDGLHYFVTTTLFKHLLTQLYEINEVISESNAILLLYLDPQIFSSDELALIRNEFEPLPSKQVDDIKIKDELFDIIAFIQQENKKNTLVSYKKIMSRFDIVYYTASKRVKQLVEEGLVFTKKYGKSRVVHLTEKAKTLLSKRDML